MPARRPAPDTPIPRAGALLAGAAGLVLAGAAALGAGVKTPPLQIQVYTADEGGFGATSTLIEGRREAILVDAQLRNSDALRLADRIDSTKRSLKAIFVTHPDDDHYLGLAMLHQRFPGASIFMTAAALAEFRRTVAGSLAGRRKAAPSETPESEPTPEALPGRPLLVDGEAVEILADLQGDYPSAPLNSPVWIPSLRTVIAGDVAFNGVHPWLAGSTGPGRAAWRASLERLAALHPRVVVAGHKKSPDLEDSPAVLAFMIGYLDRFDALRKTSPDADSFVAAMDLAYPNLAQKRFLILAAKSAYGQ